MKAPLNTVKDKFGDKAKLVAALESFAKDGELWLGRTNEDKGLAHVSNAKLIRLHETFTTVKAKFGTRSKLIDAICEIEKRTKDAGYKSRLSAYPVPRLFDMYKSAEKRHAPKVVKAKKAAPKKEAKAAPKKAASKTSAKKSAAKKR
jgi:hypothetical protein